MGILRKFDISRAVGAYAAVLTIGFAAFVLAGAGSLHSGHFQELDVERINVREPDGTLRMAISSHARMPGLIWGKDEFARPDRTQAGMLFYNDEGGENGGLIFSGGMVNGQPTSGGSLTFDRYHQDQTVQLLGVQEGQQRFSGIYVNDQPEQAQDFAAIRHIAAMPDGPERDAAYRVANVGEIPRAFLGRDRDKSSKLVLRDGQGRKRLVLSVTEAGEPLIQFLNPMGKVVRSIQ